MYQSRFIARMCLLVALATLASTLSAAAMKEIDDASAAARAAARRSVQLRSASQPAPDNSASATLPTPQQPAPSAELLRLEKALTHGEEINTSLRDEVQKLEREREQLVQIQAILTSGLVGALVTAIVAIAGAIVTSRNSRPERDLKRLAVVEKLHELQVAGTPVPKDIESAYGPPKLGNRSDR